MDDRLARLKAELAAIELWDEVYRRDKTHDEIDEVSYRIRQQRRREIMREMERLLASACGKLVAPTENY